MDFNQLSKQPFIKDLLCSLCKNYLSYFPIHITVDDKNVCGRCELPKDVTCVRNKVYEIIAEEVTFPCRYLSEGCIEKLSPKDMADHEKQCHLRVVKCPASEFDSCTESFSLPEVTKHCTDKHSDLILKDGKFDIFLSISESTKYLVIQDDDVFIFTQKFDSTSGILDCNLSSSVLYKQTKEYQIDLVNCFRTLSITGYASDDPKSSTCNNICLNVLQEDKRDSTFIMGTLIMKGQKEEQASKIQFSKEVLKLLEMPVCSSCSNYSTPSSSSVCAYSYGDLIMCSSCKRNDYYTEVLTCNFEKLKKELYFYCPNRNNGCDYIGRDVSFSEHKLHCPYEIRYCIFIKRENCKWTDLGNHLASHVNEKHAKYLATSSQFTVQLTKNRGYDYYDNTSLTQVIKLSSYFFLLSFSLKDLCCCWSVQMISSFEKTFKYELEILDTSGCQKLIVTRMCSALTDESEIFSNSNNYCYFSTEQIKGMLQNNQLMFKIHIFKQC